MHKITVENYSKIDDSVALTLVIRIIDVWNQYKEPTFSAIFIKENVNVSIQFSSEGMLFLINDL